MIYETDIAKAIEHLGLRDREVCIHSSMRSFGAPVDGGPGMIAGAFLRSGCTLMVPTFSYKSE